MTHPATASQRRQAIEEEAARLFLMARDSDTEEAWARAYAWVAQDPAHGVAFARIEAGWDKAEALRGCEENPATPDPPPVETRAKPPHVSRRTFGGLAVGLGLGLAAVAGGAWLRFAAPQRFSTAVGENRAVNLADGSVVHLNTDSAITVEMAEHLRSVRLLHGEARFDVAHDQRRPFVVSLEGGSVRALGTAFNLRQRKDFAELTVLSGRVLVSGEEGAAVAVATGISAMIRPAAVVLTHITPIEVQRRSAWQDGMILLDGETLGDAVEEFNRYRPHPLVIGAPDIAALRIGGSFSTTRSDEFVAALHSSFGIRVVTANDGAVILLPEDGEDMGHS